MQVLFLIKFKIIVDDHHVIGRHLEIKHYLYIIIYTSTYYIKYMYMCDGTSPKTIILFRLDYNDSTNCTRKYYNNSAIFWIRVYYLYVRESLGCTIIIIRRMSTGSFREINIIMKGPRL